MVSELEDTQIVITRNASEPVSKEPPPPARHNCRMWKLNE